MKLDTKVLLNIDNNDIDVEKKNMISNHMYHIVCQSEYGSSDWHAVLILCLLLKNSIEINNSDSIGRYLNMLADEVGTNQDIEELRKCLDT